MPELTPEQHDALTGIKQHFHVRLRWRRRVSRALDLLLDEDHYPKVDELYGVPASREPEDVVHR
jgi:hypothetical protein